MHAVNWNSCGIAAGTKALIVNFPTLQTNLCLNYVTTPILRWHLSNRNITFKRWPAFRQCWNKCKVPWQQGSWGHHGAIMGPIWGRQDSGGPHVGPMNFVIWKYNKQRNLEGVTLTSGPLLVSPLDKSCRPHSGEHHHTCDPYTANWCKPLHRSVNTWHKPCT